MTNNNIKRNKLMNFRFPEEEYLSEMARIGFVDSYEVYVWTNDPGNIPHFHFRDTNTQGDLFHTCIEIERCKYFHHNGKEDVLNSKMRKNLCKFLQSPNEDFENMSNWEFLVRSWNINNSNKKINVNVEMPDYTKLEDK